MKQWEKEWSEYFWNEFVLKHEDKIDWSWLSLNPNITWDIVKENPDKPWSWYWLSSNPNITMDIIKEKQDKPWDWAGLSDNPNITMDIVKANPDKPWDYSEVSYNPNLTFELIFNNPCKNWYWHNLSTNPFTKEREMFMERKLREHNAAFKIQTYWRRANYDPEYELCKRRIMRECKMLGIKD